MGDGDPEKQSPMCVSGFIQYLLERAFAAVL